MQEAQDSDSLALSAQGGEAETPQFEARSRASNEELERSTRCLFRALRETGMRPKSLRPNYALPYSGPSAAQAR
jgi:hypothetical protein